MAVGGINASQPLVGQPGPVAGQPATAAAPTPAGAGSGIATQQRGPAAWDDTWAKRFKEAGAPAEVIQQLTFTGAMGADAAQLEQILGQLTSEIDTQLAKFSHDHPEAFRKLRGNPAVDRAMLAQIATTVNAGQMPKAQLEELVNSVGKSQGKVMFDTFVKPMLVWSLIPGWGALRLGFAPFTGGKDPLTGEKMFEGGLATTMTVLMGIGGAFTIANNVRGAMQISQAHKLVAGGGGAAVIAANEGVANLSKAGKIASYLPGSNTNRIYAGISRLDDDLTQGISRLSGVHRESADSLLDAWRSGKVSIQGDSASKLGKMGFQPNARGVLINRQKAPFTITVRNGTPTILFDLRTSGKTLAAEFAAAGASFADDTNGLRSRIFQGMSQTDPKALKAVQERMRGGAAQQLLDAGFISRPTGVAKLWGGMRPGPLQEALWAAQNVANGAIGAAHGTKAIPMPIKFGLGGLAAAGAGYFMMVKPAQDAAKQAATQSQEAAAAAPQGAAPAGTSAQPTAELQAALQQFAAMPRQEQQQLLQQQYTTLQQAAQQPGLTADQQQQIIAATQEFELFVQVFNGGAATPAAAPAAPAAPVQPGFTAQGLGLPQQ